MIHYSYWHQKTELIGFKFSKFRSPKNSISVAGTIKQNPVYADYKDAKTMAKLRLGLGLI